jgi:hypothetical protein
MRRRSTVFHYCGAFAAMPAAMQRFSCTSVPRMTAALAQEASGDRAAGLEDLYCRHLFIDRIGDG